MTRVPRGYIARRQQTKMHSFATNFRGAHLRLNRLITQQVKRDFRCLWITRINTKTQIYKLFNSYSKLIHNLYKNKLILNRQLLAQVGVSNPNNLYIISKKIKIIY